MNTPELLMPAGDPQRLSYALAFGADAVYAGVPRYSLRTRENGFSEKNIVEAIKYTHSAGKKIYLAMNIFPHNVKIDGMLDAFCRFSDMGPDAFIVSDVGIISQMRKLRPGATIHLSTQANATNWATVAFYRDMGIKRISPNKSIISKIDSIHNNLMVPLDKISGGLIACIPAPKGIEPYSILRKRIAATAQNAAPSN